VTTTYQEAVNLLSPEAPDTLPQPDLASGTQETLEQETVSSEQETTQVSADVGPKLWSSSKQGLKMLLYGASGVGKTVFASSAPRPIFFDADGGLLSVVTPVPYFPIISWTELQRAYAHVAAHPNDYDTVVVDSLNELQTVSLRDVIQIFPAGRGGIPNRTYFDQPSPSDWGKSLNDLERFVLAMRRLPQNVIFILTVGDLRSPEDPIRPFLRGRNTAAMVCRNMDVVGYMRLIEQDGSVLRQIVFESAQAETKRRIHSLPAILHNPSWQTLQTYLP